MPTKENSFFVYQCWTKDTLYKSGLTEQEAQEAREDLNSLIESGACGDGEALVGNTFEPGFYYVCERVGLEPNCKPPTNF